MNRQNKELTMPIHDALKDFMFYIEKAVGNDVTAHLDEMRKKRGSSVYHAVAYAHILFCRAGLSLHKEDVSNAAITLAEATQFCHARRKLTSAIYRMVFSEDYNSHTTEQVHAELCYAICLLADAILTMLQDPSFISLVHGALKFRSCYSAFKECIALLKQRMWRDDEEKVHFESGIMCGMGVYNLIISSLPPKVLNLLEFIGFRGDEATGEHLLLEQTERFEGFMSVFSCIALLVHQSYLQYIFGNGNSDLEMVNKVVQQFVTKFPNAAIGLYFQGRTHQIHGRIDRALQQFEVANNVMDDFIPFDAFFNWDHAYLYSIMNQWDDALRVINNLHEKCSWSEATTLYLKGICTYMKELKDKNNNNNNNSACSHEAVYALMSKVGPSCKKIAGRTIPLEVFCAMKARTFLERGRLTLPHYELMYLWGFFNMFSKNNDTMAEVKEVIEAEVTQIRTMYEEDEAYLSDWCLVRLMQGTILRYNNKLGSAEAAFREVIMHGPELRDEVHTAAFASLELSLLHIDGNNLEKAKEQIKATRQFRGFPLSIPLSFKVHAADKRVKQLLEEDPCDREDNC